MRWVALTAALAAAWMAGAAWIYLRDREPVRPGAVGPSQARAAAERLLCDGGAVPCRPRVLRAEGPGRWRVRMSGPPDRCFSVGLDVEPALRAVRCR